MLKAYIEKEVLKVIEKNVWEYDTEEVEAILDLILIDIENNFGLDTVENEQQILDEGYADQQIIDWESDTLRSGWAY